MIRIEQSPTSRHVQTIALSCQADSPTIESTANQWLRFDPQPMDRLSLADDRRTV